MTTTAKTTEAGKHLDRTYGHIDMQTGDDALHRDVFYTLVTNLPDSSDIEHRQEWTFAFRIPVRILEVLGPEDVEFVLRKLDDREGKSFSVLEAVIIAAKMTGATGQDVREEMTRLVAENVYRVFSMKQVKLGNKAWVVPSSLQEWRHPNA